ncbi:hypothetical protein PsorP6_018165 [Peronosclerospora sorghi]|uniref:Uncharacterized protein n=1 Tax=Peronosclerospora sorghi TaxID=230839 RepID=A0ACC0WC24_9STRA|nr:hypothetical protein PsorP6_018165 [Peronosclerospora sorghi]
MLAQIQDFPLEIVQKHMYDFRYNLEKVKVKDAKEYREELERILTSEYQDELKALTKYTREDYCYTAAYFVLLKCLEKDKNIEYPIIGAAEMIDTATHNPMTEPIATEIQKAQFKVWKGFAGSITEDKEKVFRHSTVPARSGWKESVLKQYKGFLPPKSGKAARLKSSSPSTEITTSQVKKQKK